MRWEKRPAERVGGGGLFYRSLTTRAAFTPVSDLEGETRQGGAKFCIASSCRGLRPASAQKF